tara:strand:+ start:3905 stop:4759 length:855 start_codon:yes stop_codon:yes gene_type:complete
MPELPEVEIVKRGLDPVMRSQVINECEIFRSNLRYPFPPDFCEVLRGAKVESLCRRGKYLLIYLSNGYGLIWHLGMSGSVKIFPAKQSYPSFERVKHDHVVIHMQGGAVIVYHDPRRFGFMLLEKTENLNCIRPFSKMGPEPLGNAFNGDVLAELLQGRKSNIKAALLDQNVIAGIGNIYACEALYMARIDPARICTSLDKKEVESLARSVRQVLQKAIQAGGSSLKDYCHTDGNLGYFQHMFGVYNREGENCPDCDCDLSVTGGVQRIVQNGRSTFYCPRQQN